MDAILFKRYRRKRPKVDASIFDSALSHTRQSDASEKEKKILASTLVQIRLSTSFESSLVSVNFKSLTQIKAGSAIGAGLVEARKRRLGMLKVRNILLHFLTSHLFFIYQFLK